MNINKAKFVRRQRRKRGIRKRALGTAEKPRLSVCRSHKNISAQIIDDLKGVTICQASTLNKDMDVKAGGNKEAAKAVGAALAQRATAAGVTAVVFDRNGYQYHGRIKELADAAREAGLKF